MPRLPEASRSGTSAFRVSGRARGTKLHYALFNNVLTIRIAPVNHKGKALRAALTLILWTLMVPVAVAGIGIVAGGSAISFVAKLSALLFGLWSLFALFCLWFFRDPDPRVPQASDAIVAPAHGKVDAIEETTEPDFLGGVCRRISIFLSVIEVHVQKAPVAGKLAHLKHTPGQFLSALKSESAVHNENVLIGFESSEKSGERISVRLIAGVLARRIIPWAAVGNQVARGERISLIQFGSRVDLYLPISARVQVQLGDTVRGGETVVATRA
ncbi:MAG TPA: phosphatidylserine decarboxylase [Candidatus Nitrosotalea sp.]|nr:phosphatidylserine decarboxylase [Candidatus Nitrosotalea sp.]